MRERATSLALFCKVVDNFGDVGICSRLARQLHREHGIAVTLWVDDLQTFQRISPEIDIGAADQVLDGVLVRQWQQQPDRFETGDVADIVIEFFGCNIPENYIAAMAACEPRPVWLNLEGLTAEEWVEGCHTLPSPHPRLALTKYFFYPGFTKNTGGLLHEASLPEHRRDFQSDPASMATFLASLGVTADEAAAFKVSLFCYPHAPVTELLDHWQRGKVAITCLVPEGVAVKAVEAFLGAAAISGAVLSCGALTLRVVPFVSQPDYDRLLWACDLNIVRGEDSFVRAQWAGKPFLWHIYAQDENLHHVKLRAFLQRYASGIESLIAASLYFNGAPAGQVEDALRWSGLWPEFYADMPRIMARAADWQLEMLANGDLSTNLLRFASSLQSGAQQNKI